MTSPSTDNDGTQGERTGPPLTRPPALEREEEDASFVFGGDEDDDDERAEREDDHAHGNDDEEEGSENGGKTKTTENETTTNSKPSPSMTTTISTTTTTTPIQPPLSIHILDGVATTIRARSDESAHIQIRRARFSSNQMVMETQRDAGTEGRYADVLETGKGEEDDNDDENEREARLDDETEHDAGGSDSGGEDGHHRDALMQEERAFNKYFTPTLRGMFYAVFDDELGPKVVDQVPEDDFLSEASFLEMEHVLLRREFADTVVSLRSGELEVMSVPMCLEDKKRYKRNRFLFAFGMVFRSGDDSGPYRLALKKMSRILAKLERDSKFLSSAPTGAMKRYLRKVMDDLVTRGESFLRLEKSSTLSLKLSPRLLPPPPVSDYQVPLPVKSIKSMMLKDWDLTVQRIEPHVDGRKFVKKIAVDSNVALEHVKRALQQLLYYRAIIMVDLFQYSNRYACTKEISKLLPTPAAHEDAISNSTATATSSSSTSKSAQSSAALHLSLQSECRRYVAVRPDVKLPAFGKILVAYASLHPRAPFGDFVLDFDFEGLGIDPNRFINFGLRLGILQRKKLVPIFVNSSPTTRIDSKSHDRRKDGEHPHPEPPVEALDGRAASANNDEIMTAPPPFLHPDKQRSSVRRLVDGKNTFDEICGKTGISHAELSLLIDNMDDVVVMMV